MQKILIVEDDPGMRDVFPLIFDAQIYHLTLLSNGSAILAGDFDIPDIFVIDMQLSGVDGLDLCRLLKTQPRTAHLPVIMISANPRIQQMALQAGAEAGLEKPFSMNMLRDTIKTYLPRN